MKTSIALGLGLILTAASSALGASSPPSTLIAGSSAQNTATGPNAIQCVTGAGLATFQRAAPTLVAANPQALIDLPGAAYAGPSPAPVIYYYGMTILTFTTATSGTVSFDYNLASPKLPDAEKVAFSGYSQVWAPVQKALRVKFNIPFPNCTLPVSLLFRAAAPS